MSTLLSLSLSLPPSLSLSRVRVCACVRARACALQLHSSQLFREETRLEANLHASFLRSCHSALTVLGDVAAEDLHLSPNVPSGASIRPLGEAP